MSTPEITMDDPENPQREPSRRTDLSALAWRRRSAEPAGPAEPSATEPNGSGQAPGGLAEHREADAEADAEAAPPNGFVAEPHAAEAAPPNGFVAGGPHEANGVTADAAAQANGAVRDTGIDDEWTPPEPWSPPEWPPPAPAETVEPAEAVVTDDTWATPPQHPAPPGPRAPAETAAAPEAPESEWAAPQSQWAAPQSQWGPEPAGWQAVQPPAAEPESEWAAPQSQWAAPQSEWAAQQSQWGPEPNDGPQPAEPAPSAWGEQLWTGAEDSEPADAVTVDAVTVDAMTAEAVTVDAVTADAMTAEAVTVDAEPIVAEVLDAEVVDAEVVDDGPAGVPAMSIVDALAATDARGADGESAVAEAGAAEPVEASAPPVVEPGVPGPYERQGALHVPTMEYPVVARSRDGRLAWIDDEPAESLAATGPAADPLAATEAVDESTVDEAWAGPDAASPEPAAPIVDPQAPEPAVVEPETPVAAAAVADLPPIESILPPAEGYREVGYDTVVRAMVTGSEFQPYLELGLQPDEYARIRQILGRRPTEAELAMYAVMWSEHCSYKSSKVHLRQFGELAERIREQQGDQAPAAGRMLAGIGANAGVVQISDRLAVTFKVESHNHPSFVEPHQGAATGVGGIVRDILAMGARPVAVMDPLRFGAPDHEDTRRVLPGVVAGIGGYGNCLGLPNIGGEVVFDECYQGNPLVNALCVGVLPVDKLQQKAATGPGNVVVLIGAKTGRDGIGGVSVLASATFGQGSETRRPSVQVGDPFLEKLLIEACLEIYDLNLTTAIQDLGGAGLTCALSEMSAAAGLGMAVNLDLVPLREASMRSEEVLASESQERMLLVVTPENLPVVLSICARWGVLATAIGEVTPAESPEGGRLRIWWRGEVIVDVPPGSLADDGPVYARPMREPFDRELMRVDRPETLPRPETPSQLRDTMLRLVGSPNLCDKSWVTEQYDRYVLGNTVLAQPEDSGIVRIDEATGLGVALAVDGNGRYARLDPYAGAKLALAEAYRNVAVTGAVPVAVTNCLNFGSPEDAGVMWQFAEAVRGLADGCVELGIPVTGGNVSFYNQTGGNAINPTPIVGVLGVLGNVARRVPMGFSGEGDAIFLLGQTRDELGGSEWAHVTHGHLGGAPPAVDLGAEQRLAALLAEAAGLGHLTAAHDLSDGGLAQALVESCLRRNVGAHVALPPDGQSAFVHLFSESSARAIVSVRKGQEQAFAALADERGVPRTALGIVTGTSLVFDELFTIGLDELRRAHTATMPALFD